MFFATISGSSSAATAAIGSTLIPAMARKGYPKPFAAACAAVWKAFANAFHALLMPIAILGCIYRG